ncbi:hypothetical protein GOP47_0015971 [Adiantum capillus-veneris]|uniref:Pentatricopeptide repeat-containing protein n=1 Tax=Adiantum capillus-veneris TaxID=13818 RepID=A0A9D4ZDQ4_ADICA|nr:hypothetical protein GOP47_0015971 [Adiantum capillus-veneris]
MILLRSCAKMKDLSAGITVHDDIVKRGLLEKCSDALISMYAKCGNLAKAKELLDTHKSRDVISWIALISGYAQQGQSLDGLESFEKMQDEGLSPDWVTFTCALKACGSLRASDKGEQILDEIVRQGLLGNNIVLDTAVVDMYAKCGALTKAQEVLEGLPVRNVVCWSALISGYAQDGQSKQALDCFWKMQEVGIAANAVTYTSVLKACGSLGASHMGDQIHDEIRRQGLLKRDVVLGTALVDMYAKRGQLVKAQRLLEKLTLRDVVTWNALLVGYTQQCQAENALDCFARMQREGISPNAVPFSCILKACGSIGAISKGEEIHNKIASQGLFENNTILGNAVVDMYAKCGAVAKAQQVLEEFPHRDVASWNALMTGWAQQGKCE